MRNQPGRLPGLQRKEPRQRCDPIRRRISAVQQTRLVDGCARRQRVLIREHMICAQDVGDAICGDDSSQRTGHELARLRIRGTETRSNSPVAQGAAAFEWLVSKAHGCGIAQPRSHRSRLRKLLGEEVIWLDQVFRQLMLDVNTHTEHSRRSAALDFASHPNANHIVSRMHAYHRGGMAAWRWRIGQQALHRFPLGTRHVCRDITASHVGLILWLRV